MTDATRYPLSWPLGWPRKPAGKRVRARFSKGERKYYSSGQGSYMSSSALTVPQGLDRLRSELERLRARDIIISTNVELNSYGDPRGGRGPRDARRRAGRLPRQGPSVPPGSSRRFA